MQHLDEGTIHAWLDGALPTAEARDVEQHVAACAECAASVAEARGLIAGASRIVSSLDVVRGNVIPKTPAARGGKSLWHSLHLTPARAALAATLMIAVSSLLTIRHDTPEKMVPPPAPAGAPTRQPRVDAPAAAASAAGGVTSPAVTDAARANETPAPQMKEKDRAEVVSKPKAEMRADVAADAIKRDSLRAEAAKASAVAAAPPAAPTPLSTARGAASANSLDTSATKTLAKAVVADSIRSGQEQFRRASSFAATRNTSSIASIVKCFQFVDRQVPGVPQRFALQALPQDTSQRIVRAIDENGRLDTVITGGSWMRMNQTEITVRFAANSQPLTLLVHDAALGAAVVDTRQEAARRAGLGVSPIMCRP